MNVEHRTSNIEWRAGKPDQGASVAVEAMAVGLLDVALEWEDIGVFAYLFIIGI